jgi:AraC family transcriptional regulator, regulatory protein of adaptative response / methylated-DNA-[protein]-cysteine methyltransferase
MSTELLADQETLWTAVASRDKGFDGKFYFGVLTTGVYCRPSCACRPPLRENVRFFQDAASAERAGLRACKRCRPNEAPLNVQYAERIHKLAGYIRTHSGEALPLSELALRSGLSQFHLQRSFKAVMGVTPRQFVEACRLERLKGQLRADAGVTDAIYEAGFGSSSRVYEKVNTHLGMTPAQYRSGGKKITISYAAVDSALGRMMIGATDRGICFIQFADSDKELVQMLSDEYPAAILMPMRRDSEEHFRSWMTELHKYLAGEVRRLDLPLDLRATAFQMKVWRYLQSIPYGSVKSYSEVAIDLDQPKAARAVARACATNKVALLIPCHRVIRGSGDLAGYKWGLARKRTLLDQERRSGVK